MSKLYTAGELAKIAGVSARTIRFYDEKGILKPCGYSKGDYRLYNEDAIFRLQQIVMFKYVGFSLEEISRLISREEVVDVGAVLDKQKELMLKKREQTERIIYALDKAKASCMSKDFDSEHFVEIMQLITKNDIADKRYNVYERFSTRQEEWYRWRFEMLNLQENMKILDVGGGYGTPWMRVWESIPAGCQILMLDKDSKGREYLKNFIRENGHRLAVGVSFQFWDADAEEVSYEKEKYDRILTNHFWGYIEEKSSLMKKLRVALKAEGMMYSTIPSMVNKADVEGIVTAFLQRSVKTGINAEKEATKKELEDCMRQCFSVVREASFENSLRINEAEAVYEYLCDSDVALRQVLEKRQVDFFCYMQNCLQKEEAIEIRVDGPLYICKK